MKSNTRLYPFWNPGNSGAAAGFANPTGLAATTLAAALGESRVLQVPQEISVNNNFLRVMQYVPSATRIPGPQMPATIPVIPGSDLLSQAQASLLASLGVK